MITKIIYFYLQLGTVNNYQPGVCAHGKLPQSELSLRRKKDKDDVKNPNWDEDEIIFQ